MELSSKQKAFLEFIPISQLRNNVLKTYALVLFFVPLLIGSYYKNIDIEWLRIIIFFDIALFLMSIPVLIKPNIYYFVFHVFVGLTSVYVSFLLLGSFLIEVNRTHKFGAINLGFSVVIYVIAVFTENFLIVKLNFLKYPKKSSKIIPSLLIAPIIGMLVYNVSENMFYINGMAIAAYILAIGLGIPIHSLYRGYIMLKYNYKPSNL